MPYWRTDFKAPLLLVVAPSLLLLLCRTWDRLQSSAPLDCRTIAALLLSKDRSSPFQFHSHINGIENSVLGLVLKKTEFRFWLLVSILKIRLCSRFFGLELVVTTNKILINCSLILVILPLAPMLALPTKARILCLDSL